MEEQITEEEKRKKHKEFLERLKALRNKNNIRGKPDEDDPKKYYENKPKEESKKGNKTSKGKGGPAPFFKKTVG